MGKRHAAGAHGSGLGGGAPRAHRGGFVRGDLDTHDHVCRELCTTAPCLVVSVDYRLSPEHPFPAAFDDCLASTRWARANAAALRSDARCLLVAGDSAGGMLCGVMAQPDLHSEARNAMGESCTWIRALQSGR